MYGIRHTPKSVIPLTIWMNMPTFYQGDLFRALAASGEVDLEVIFAKPLTGDRLDLGWQNDLAGYSYSFLNRRNSILDAVWVAWRGRRRVHVVNGLWAEPAFAAALITLSAVGSAVAVYSEAPDITIARSPLKLWLQGVLGGLLGRRLSGVLAISHLADDFYRRLGVRKRAIYPFGYFRSQPEPDVAGQAPAADRSEIIYVGQLIHRKGLDLLIEAVAPLLKDHTGLTLAIVGTGPMLEPLRAQVAAHGLGNRITFEGVLPSGQVPARLRRADLLALPSRWDGWGMVVNEAFSVGLPVIASDCCGASDLIRDGSNGWVFRSGEVADLRRCLGRFLTRKAEWPQMRSEAASVGREISAEAVAPYLAACLRHMAGMSNRKPTPPWAEPGPN